MEEIPRYLLNKKERQDMFASLFWRSDGTKMFIRKHAKQGECDNLGKCFPGKHWVQSFIYNLFYRVTATSIKLKSRYKHWWQRSFTMVVAFFWRTMRPVTQHESYENNFKNIKVLIRFPGLKTLSDISSRILKMSCTKKFDRQNPYHITCSS